MIFSSTPVRVGGGTSIPYLKLNTPFFCWPLILEEYFNL